MNEKPTLELEAARLRRAGAPLGPALTLRSDASRVGLIGDWQPLFQALTRQAQLSSGFARVLGHDLDRALAEGTVGFAACDTPLPDSFSAREYLQHAARLSHGSSARAAEDTERVLDRYELRDLATRKLSTLEPHQRRAVAVALASLGEPPLVCLEAPLRGLQALAADYVARLCAEAGTRARLIVSVDAPTSTGPERALLDSCQELFWLERGELVLSGPPSQVFAPSLRYLLTAAGPKLDEFASALVEAGCRLELRPEPGRYLIELPARESSDLLLDLALDHDLVVLDLDPLYRAQ